MPHLSCRKKERERQALIREIVKEILNYKAGEWSHESMQGQDNMFDSKATDSEKFWGKLAMNVLFSCNSKNVVRKYKEERDNFVENDWNRSTDTRMSAMEKALNIKKRSSISGIARAKSVGMKLISDLPISPKNTNKIEINSNEGGSVSSNPTQEQHIAESPPISPKTKAFGNRLTLPPGTAGMSRRGSISSNMAVTSNAGAGKSKDSKK